MESNERTNMRGGKREGAGRKVTTTPPPEIRRVRVSLPPELYIKFKKIGGRKWLIKHLMSAEADKS
jgi:hypothetical protein